MLVALALIAATLTAIGATGPASAAAGGVVLSPADGAVFTYPYTVSGYGGLITVGYTIPMRSDCAAWVDSGDQVYMDIEVEVYATSAQGAPPPSGIAPWATIGFDRTNASASGSTTFIADYPYGTGRIDGDTYTPGLPPGWFEIRATSSCVFGVPSGVNTDQVSSSWFDIEFVDGTTTTEPAPTSTTTAATTTTTTQPSPVVSIADAGVVEGNAGTTNASFTVSLDRPAPRPVSVGYATSGATATSGQDFEAASGTASIPTGGRSTVISVPVIGDSRQEPTETYQVHLGSAINATIGRGTATGTILDDDHPSLRLVVDDSSHGNGYIAASATPETPGCPAEVTLQSTNDQPLWGDVEVAADGGLPSPDPQDGLTGLGYLPPSGYGALRWNSCFDSAANTYRITVHYLSERATLAQIVGILWEATGTNLAGLINDGQLIPEIIGHLPPSFVQAVKGCLGNPFVDACLSLGYARSLVFHFDEWASLFTFLSQRTFVGQELQRLMQGFVTIQKDLKEAWNAVAPTLVSTLAGNEKAFAFLLGFVRKITAQAERDKRVAAGKVGGFERGMTRLRQVVADAKAGYAQAVTAEADAMADFRACFASACGGTPALSAFLRRLGAAQTRLHAALDQVHALEALTVKAQAVLDEAKAVLKTATDKAALFTKRLGAVERIGEGVPFIGLLVSGLVSAAEVVNEAWLGKPSDAFAIVFACGDPDAKPVCH